MVWIPKYHKKQLYGNAVKYLGEIFHTAFRQFTIQAPGFPGYLTVEGINMDIASYYTKDITYLQGIEFKLTEKCNYRCEYCFEHLSNDRHAGDDTVSNFLKLVSSMQEKGKVKLIGGEPFFHPRFFEIASCVVKSNHDLEVGTNFSLPNKLFEKIIDESKRNNQIELIASLHLSQIESIDTFVEKVISLKNYGGNKIKISVVSVLREDTFEKLLSIKEKLASHKITMGLQRLKINNGKEFYKYSENIENYLNDCSSNRKASQVEFLDVFGMFCKTGYLFIKINADGEILRCPKGQREFFCLGNINKDWRLLKESMPCLKSKCTCLLPVNWNLLEFDKYDKELANVILEAASRRKIIK